MEDNTRCKIEELASLEIGLRFILMEYPLSNEPSKQQDAKYLN